MLFGTAVSIPAPTPRHLQFLPTCLPLQAKKTCYYNDTYTRKVHAIPCNGITGVPDAKAEWRTAVQLCGEADGAPDGLAIDCHGKLWVAHEHGGQVRKLTVTRSHRSVYVSGVDLWNTCNISLTIPAVCLRVYMICVFSHCCISKAYVGADFVVSPLLIMRSVVVHVGACLCAFQVNDVTLDAGGSI